MQSCHQVLMNKRKCDDDDDEDDDDDKVGAGLLLRWELVVGAWTVQHNPLDTRRLNNIRYCGSGLTQSNRTPTKFALWQWESRAWTKEEGNASRLCYDTASLNNN